MKTLTYTEILTKPSSHLKLTLFNKTKGILGMAFETISRAKAKTVFDNLCSQYKLKRNVFSFWLNK